MVKKLFSLPASVKRQYTIWNNTTLQMEVRDLENSCGLKRAQYFSCFVLNRTEIISIREVTQIRFTCKITLCGLIQYTVNKGHVLILSLRSRH